MYTGDKDVRTDMANTAKKHIKAGNKPFDILLTTYEARQFSFRLSVFERWLEMGFLFCLKMTLV